MKISFTKTFLKQAKKLSPELRQHLKERLSLFSATQLDPIHRNHPLKGSFKDHRSINITGEIRALYLQTDNEAIFDLIGSHSQLYG